MRVWFMAQLFNVVQTLSVVIYLSGCASMRDVEIRLQTGVAGAAGTAAVELLWRLFCG